MFPPRKQKISIIFSNNETSENIFPKDIITEIVNNPLYYNTIILDKSLETIKTGENFVCLYYYMTIKAFV